MCIHVHVHVHIPSLLPTALQRSDARNEDSDDSSGDEPDHLSTGTKQKRAAQPEEQQEDLSAYERQRNANVQLNRGVLEGLGLADSALSLGHKAKAPPRKRARLEVPRWKSTGLLREEPPRPRSTRLAGRGSRRRYSQDLLGSEEEEDE